MTNKNPDVRQLPTAYGEDREALAFSDKKDRETLPRYKFYEGRPLLVYLGDLVHDCIGKGPFTMPLNVGYLAAYTQKMLGPNIHFRIFKSPAQLLAAFKERRPDAVGLSNYTWNENLGLKILERFKAAQPRLLTLMGGPNLDLTAEAARGFLTRHPWVDLYVMLQGEVGFADAIHRLISADFDLAAMKTAAIAGSSFLRHGDGGLVSGPQLSLTQLDDIPSPYLTGLMDPFFDGRYTPIMETNRGCPYACSFCAWGNAAMKKITKFSPGRLRADLEYIARRCQGLPLDTIHLADANYGIFGDRDLDFARALQEMDEKYGFPKNLQAAWAKNKTEKNLAIAEVLSSLAPVTVSFQSMNEETLKNIKRSNMKLEHFNATQEYFAQKGVTSYVEMIVGLPGETRETHRRAVAELLEKERCEVRTYNAMLLKGSEMHEADYRRRFGLQSGWRLLDNAFGVYDGLVAIEAEEIILGTDTMSRDDILFFRPMHWLIQFAQNYGYYRHALFFLKSQGVPQIELFDALLDGAAGAPAPVAALFADFKREAHSEYFPSLEELTRHFSRPENMEFLLSGGFGKMNFKYTCRVLLECKEAFDEYLARAVKTLLQRRPNAAALCRIAEEIVRFEARSVIDFRRADLFAPFAQDFKFDVLSWADNGFPAAVERYWAADPVAYEFSTVPKQRAIIENRLRIYAGVSENFRLRKMIETIMSSDMRYRCARQQERALA